GSNGLLAVSDDGGRSFRRYPHGNNSAFTDLWFEGLTNGWVVGSNGIVCKYSRTCDCWEPLPSPGPVDLRCIGGSGPTVCAGGTEGHICCWNGTNWVPSHVPGTNSIISISFPDPVHGCAVLDTGIIL